MKIKRLLSRTAIGFMGLILLTSNGLSTAHAQVTINAPAGPAAGTIVDSPFYLQAQSSTCDSAATTTIKYAIDGGTPVAFTGTSIATMVTAATGAHTLQVQAYNASGDECTSSLPVTVGGGVAVAAPSLSSGLPGTFNLSATAPTCGGQTTTLMGYGVDSGSVTTVSATSINTLVESGDTSGSHILRVKGFAGSLYCETDIPFSITGGIAAASGASLYTSSSSSYPYAGIESAANYTGTYSACSSGSGNAGANQSPYIGLWQTQPDCGTPGTKSSVSTTFPVTTPFYGLNSSSRKFAFTYASQYGGVRWFNQLADNSSANSATNFLYDLYLYIAPGSNVGAVELDLNHASPANNLYLIGVQCYAAGGKWQVTVKGSGWVNTDIPCTSSEVSTGGWHHLQVLTSHDASPGTNISYKEVAIDGKVTLLTCNSGGACESTEQSTSWAESVGPNFQLDGGTSGGGSVTAYVSNFNIWYW